jgi:predicted nucleic acid-binding protein
VIILDTNVISELMQIKPEPKVVAWIDRQPRSTLWITSITVFEVFYGLEVMPPGRKQTLLRNSYGQFLNRVGDRIAEFDQIAAEKAAVLMAAREKNGQPRDLRDTMIAGIVLANDASLVTRNVTHFDDIRASVINPWLA